MELDRYLIYPYFYYLLVPTYSFEASSFDSALLRRSLTKACALASDK